MFPPSFFLSTFSYQSIFQASKFYWPSSIFLLGILKTCFFFSNQLICTCWQLNLHCITSLRELSESAAIAVLDQVYNVVFMLLFQFFPIPVSFSSSCLAVAGSLCYRVLIDMIKEHTLLHWFPRSFYSFIYIYLKFPTLIMFVILFC